MPPPPSILLVDDHADTLLVMTRLLVRQGYDVRTARTWAEARHHCAVGGVDLMLLDLGLPDSTPAEIRASLRACRVRTIVCSGYAYPDDVRLSLEAGALGHLSKPIPAPRLVEIVRDVLGPPKGTPPAMP